MISTPAVIEPSPASARAILDFDRFVVYERTDRETLEARTLPGRETRRGRASRVLTGPVAPAGAGIRLRLRTRAGRPDAAREFAARCEIFPAPLTESSTASAQPTRAAPRAAGSSGRPEPSRRVLAGLPRSLVGPSRGEPGWNLRRDRPVAGGGPRFASSSGMLWHPWWCPASASASLSVGRRTTGAGYPRPSIAKTTLEPSS